MNADEMYDKYGPQKEKEPDIKSPIKSWELLIDEKLIDSSNNTPTLGPTTYWGKNKTTWADATFYPPSYIHEPPKTDIKLNIKDVKCTCDMLTQNIDVIVTYELNGQNQGIQKTFNRCMLLVAENETAIPLVAKELSNTILVEVNELITSKIISELSKINGKYFR